MNKGPANEGGGNFLQRRRKARQRALQALYQWTLNPESGAEVVDQFLDAQDMGNTDIPYFRELVTQTMDQVSILDEKLALYLSISLQQLDPVECCILRMSAYELNNRADIPYRVVIDEAVNLAKRYGASDGHKFINGVLDKAASDWRPKERD